MHIELMKIIERTVRTLPCDKTTKLRIRDDLYSQLKLIYEEELAKDGDESSALQRAKVRFGKPSDLRKELAATIPTRMRWGSAFNDYILGAPPGRQWIPFAARFAFRLAAIHFVMTFGMFAVLIVLGKDASVLGIWPTFLAISVLFGVNAFTFTICGLSALDALRLEEGRVKFKRPTRFVGATLGAGLSMAASYVVLMSISFLNLEQNNVPAIFLTVCAVAMMLFLVVIAMTAKTELRDREWSALDLSER